MRTPGERIPRETNPAFADLATISDNVVSLLERANGATWYEEDNDVDRAVAGLCRLRRAGAGARSGPHGGDAAVRELLGQADFPTIVWIASRTISYMDEQGFPESLGAYEADYEDLPAGSESR